MCVLVKNARNWGVFCAVWPIAACGISYSHLSYAEPIPSKAFANIIVPRAPDVSNPADITFLAKVTNELDRPCDKKEFFSWKSVNINSDITMMSSSVISELAKTYSIVTDTDSSPLAKKLNSTVQSANSKNGNGKLTLVWIPTGSVLTLGICGDNASVIANGTAEKTPPTGVKYSKPDDPLEPDPEFDKHAKETGGGKGVLTVPKNTQ